MTKAPLSGRDRACVSGKRNRASGWVVFPEFQTRKTSSPITGIQWNRTSQSTRSLSLSYWTNASTLERVLKSYSNRLADSTAVNAPTGSRAVVRVRPVLTMTWPPPRHAAVSSRSVLRPPPHWPQFTNAPTHALRARRELGSDLHGSQDRHRSHRCLAVGLAGHRVHRSDPVEGAATGPYV